jgi:hypothetical protein
VPIRLTDHAARRMRRREISHEDIEAILANPTRTDVGETAVEYDGTVRGRPLRVVVVKGSEPPLVITVHELDR